MSFQLTQKEKLLLQDQKKHEELCIQKYQNYAQQAQDPQLKQLFNSLAQKEQQHLNTINQILNGQIPNIQGSQQQQQQQIQQQTLTVPNQMQGAMNNQQDASLCNDMKKKKKYVSGTYDTTIFECTNSNIRQVLNHIQKEEQQHGEAIFNYMHSKGMYNPQ